MPAHTSVDSLTEDGPFSANTTTAAAKRRAGPARLVCWGLLFSLLAGMGTTKHGFHGDDLRWGAVGVGRGRGWMDGWVGWMIGG